MVYRCIKNNGKLGEISGKPYDCLVSPIFARDTRRIGGLENWHRACNFPRPDTRRIGGLENIHHHAHGRVADTRRIGGLETGDSAGQAGQSDTRRIGGLENYRGFAKW